ncbi:H/ACA snoRNP pseudouridylase subunit, partial [Perkinsus olseni]
MVSGKGHRAPLGPPEWVEELGEMMHVCEDEMVCKCTHTKVPYFNGRVFLENKSQIGQVDEILGPINEFYFSVKMQEGVVAKSFKPGQKVYIDGNQTLPMERFLPVKKTIGPKKHGAGGKGKGGKGKGGKGKGGKGFGKGKGSGKGKGHSGKGDHAPEDVLENARVMEISLVEGKQIWRVEGEACGQEISSGDELHVSYQRYGPRNIATGEVTEVSSQGSRIIVVLSMRDDGMPGIPPTLADIEDLERMATDANKSVYVKSQRLFKLTRVDWGSAGQTKRNRSLLLELAHNSNGRGWAAILAGAAKVQLPKLRPWVAVPVPYEIRPAFETLNEGQKRAVCAALELVRQGGSELTGDRWALPVCGYPGTGKSSMLAVLLLGLRYGSERRVLLVSHTHTAVDNLLLKAKELAGTNNLKDFDFVRLGRSSSTSVKPELAEHYPPSEWPSVESISDFLRTRGGRLVACTALACHNALLWPPKPPNEENVPTQPPRVNSSQPKVLDKGLPQPPDFDIVLVDEAGQNSVQKGETGRLPFSSRTAFVRRVVTVTVEESFKGCQQGGVSRCLVGWTVQKAEKCSAADSTLWCSLKLATRGAILVGDQYQLPPVVKDRKCRDEGMSETLFTRCARDMASIELTAQYRMCRGIQRFVNELFYEGKLKCGSREVEDAKMPRVFTTALAGPWIEEMWNPEQPVVMIDVSQWRSAANEEFIAAADEKEDGRVYSRAEAQVIKSFVTTVPRHSLASEDLVILSPYVKQVKLIQGLLAAGDRSGPEVTFAGVCFRSTLVAD